MITSFIVTCLVFLQKIPNSSFIKYENYNIDEVISQNEKYDTKSLNNITTVLNDLLEGYTGEGYNLEEEIEKYIDNLKLGQEFNDEIFTSLVDNIVVRNRYELEFQFKIGIKKIIKEL